MTKKFIATLMIAAVTSTALATVSSTTAELTMIGDQASLCLTEQRMTGPTLDGAQCQKLIALQKYIYGGSQKVWAQNKIETNQINKSNFDLAMKVQKMEIQALENGSKAEKEKHVESCNKFFDAFKNSPAELAKNQKITDFCNSVLNK